MKYLVVLVTIVVTTILLIFSIITESNILRNSIGSICVLTTSPEFNNIKQSVNTEINYVNEFYKMALRHSTDKVNGHSYQGLYGLYLGPIRYKNLTIIEIGLGCDMHYGPGKSLNLWREYLPNSEIHILEYNEKCARKFENLVDKLYTGDQSDMQLLKKIASASKYDLIVDDGGHTRKQQVNSLIGLWPSLKPNGVYVIEDIFTSLQMNGYNDLNISTVKVMEYFIYRFNHVGVPVQNWNSALDPIFDSVLSVNCFREACVLIKKS